MNKNIMWVKKANKKPKTRKPIMNKTRLKQTLLLSVALMLIVTLTGILPPVFNTLEEGKYLTLGTNSEGYTEWIAAGCEDNYLSGRFFKVDRNSHDSGRPASDFEVLPAGFPISCGFTEEIWKGEVGFYAPNWFILVDYVFWFALSAAIVFFFYPRARTKVEASKIAKKRKQKA